jgi:hypothetical protein
MEKRDDGRETAEGAAMHTCQKYGIAMCEACLKCRGPKIYCKFRSACTIHFLTRRHADRQRETPRN